MKITTGLRRNGKLSNSYLRLAEQADRNSRAEVVYGRGDRVGGLEGEPA